MNASQTDRLTELEIKLGLAEDSLDQLNHSVYRQQKQIDLLQEQLREMHRRLPSNNDSAAEPINLRDEIPPHY